MTKWIKLILIGLFSTAVFTLNNIFPIPSWYEPLTNEVWTLTFEQVNYAEIILYILSGVAFWMVWKNRPLGTVKWSALAYGGILISSALWALFFFGQQIPLLAFLDMLGLVVLIVIAALEFYKFEKTAAYLLVPCIIGAVFFLINNFMLYQGYTELFSA